MILSRNKKRLAQGETLFVSTSSYTDRYDWMKKLYHIPIIPSIVDGAK